MIAVSHRARGQAGDVGATARLGDRQRADLPPGQDRRHPARPLLGGAELDDRRRRDAVAAQADHRADRGPGHHQLLRHRQDVAEVAAGAADLLGVADAHEARGRQLAVQRARELAGLVPGVGVGRQRRLGEPPGLSAQGGVLVGLEQVRHRAHGTAVAARAP